MNKLTVEWDPSWDDDWQTSLQEIEDEMEEARPSNPEQAIKSFQYGYSAARRHPSRPWSEIESEFYQDYMGSAHETGEPEEEWEEARDWALRGWRTHRS